MTALGTQWLWWIFGTFGLVGLVAFWFAAPTAASLALQIVVRLFKLVLSYRIGCALLAALVTGLIVDQQRHAYDDEQFVKRTALFEAAQETRDARIAQETRDKVWLDIGNAAIENKTIDNGVKEFTNALPPAAPSGNPFLISDVDAGRLCVIAYGKAGCRSAGDKGMPAARRPGRSAHDSKVRLPSIIRGSTWTAQ